MTSHENHLYSYIYSHDQNGWKTKTFGAATYLVAQNEATSSGTFMHDARVIWNEIAYQAARALMCDDVRLSKITTKPRFDDAKCKF